MKTGRSIHRWRLTASAFALAASACRLETVDLYGISSASGGSPDQVVAPGVGAGGSSGVPPPQPEPIETLTDAAAPLPLPPPPEADFHEPLPDAGVDLSPLPPVPGCRAIDFLFVVDNSLSMTDEQDNLVRSFPGFLQVVQSTLDARDYHIMAIDTDDRGIFEGGMSGGPFVSPASCNGVFGAGRDNGAAGEDCGMEGGTYMTSAQPNIAESFACAARVGTFGDVLEQPITALLSAISPALNAADGCNAGFLREDAILVVTLITDSDDTRSLGSPSVWRQQLVAAKGNDESAVVVLGLLGDSTLIQPLEGGPCLLPEAGPAPRLQEFVEELPHGSLGSICADDYSPFLARAVAEIKASCDAFRPPVP
jgi:hypothetical protein